MGRRRGSQDFIPLTLAPPTMSDIGRPLKIITGLELTTDHFQYARLTYVIRAHDTARLYGPPLATNVRNPRALVQYLKG